MSEGECPICLCAQRFPTACVPCGHTACAVCLWKWVSRERAATVCHQCRHTVIALMPVYNLGGRECPSTEEEAVVLEVLRDAPADAGADAVPFGSRSEEVVVPREITLEELFAAPYDDHSADANVLVIENVPVPFTAVENGRDEYFISHPFREERAEVPISVEAISGRPGVWRVRAHVGGDQEVEEECTTDALLAPGQPVSARPDGTLWVDIAAELERVRVNPHATPPRSRLVTTLVVDALLLHAVRASGRAQWNNHVAHLDQRAAHRAGLHLLALHHGSEGGGAGSRASAPSRPFEAAFNTRYAMFLFTCSPWLFACASEFMTSEFLVTFLESAYQNHGALTVRDYLSPRAQRDPVVMGRLSELDHAFTPVGMRRLGELDHAVATPSPSAPYEIGLVADESGREMIE